MNPLFNSLWNTRFLDICEEVGVGFVGYMLNTWCSSFW